MTIEPYSADHLDAIIRLSLRAWAPVFDSIQTVMHPKVYQQLHPDWRVSQTNAVEKTCTAEDVKLWVAIETGSVAGFVAVKLHPRTSMGEIYMLAVDPDFQRRGMGTALTQFALRSMRDAGMSVAMVDTGGDHGHAPARRTYEKQGFDLSPIARYFKKL